MGCKAVAEGVGGDALGELGPPDRFTKGFLDMRFMKMISPQFLSRRNLREGLLREEPLPDKILGCRWILLLQSVVKKHA